MTPDQIKATRKALGLIQSEFANLVNVHHVTVCRWEKGHKTPNPWQAELVGVLFETIPTIPQHVLSQIRSLLAASGPIAVLGLLLPVPSPPKPDTRP